MSEILNINKPVGITSYDVIRNLKMKYPNQKIGHAGTLDPLADGVLICLVGDQANSRQEEFMNSTKEYVFEILFGFGSDTFDILGFPLEYKGYDIDQVQKNSSKEILALVGEFDQQVPPFSAVKVNGKPLYRWYLSGKINEVQIPIKQINIKNIEILKDEVLGVEILEDRLLSLLDTVKTGFRNEDIKKMWKEKFCDSEVIKQKEFLILTVKAVVSKGTYVRAIANDLGKMIGVPACTMKITRTRVGEMRIEEAELI